MHGQGPKSEQKHATKGFDEFHNHSPLLTMVNRKVACKQALRMGYSEICFRIARGRASQESLGLHCHAI